MADIESPLIFETAALNVNPAPEGMPPASSPNIVYSEGRESLAMLKRWWNRVNPTVTSGGSANAQTLAYSVAPTEGYKTGQTFTFIAGFSNSGACTLNVNGLGAKAIQSNGTALTAGMIIAGSITQCMYDNAGNFQLTLAGSGAYLPLTGGTLTGALTIAPPSGNAAFVLSKFTAGQLNIIWGQTALSPRWRMILGNGTAEGGGNSGSDLQLDRFTDAGAFIDTPLTITRSGGHCTFTGQVKTNTSLAVTGAAGTNRSLYGLTATALRWEMVLGSTGAEGGSNAGSDFAINRYNDAGAFIDTPLAINRTSGAVALSGTLTALNAKVGTNGFVLDTPTPQVRPIYGTTNGSLRWSMYMGDSTAEGGGNAGSNSSLNAYDNTGTALGAVWTIVRATRVVTFGVAIVNGPSDRSLKENIAPLEDSLDKVLALQGVSFDFIGKEGRQIGLIAQDVAPIVPEVIQDYQSQDGEGQPTAGLLAIDYPKLVAVLIEAVKTLNAKVTALEARLPPETLTA